MGNGKKIIKSTDIIRHFNYVQMLNGKHNSMITVQDHTEEYMYQSYVQYLCHSTSLISHMSPREDIPEWPMPRGPNR